MKKINDLNIKTKKLIVYYFSVVKKGKKIKK